MANNYDQYSNEFECPHCEHSFTNTFYTFTQNGEKSQVTKCTKCGEQVSRPAIKFMNKPVYKAPLPKPEPRTKKIGRSTWTGLPTDVAMIYEIRERVKNLDDLIIGSDDHRQEVEELLADLKSPILEKFSDEAARIAKDIGKYYDSKDKANG